MYVDLNSFYNFWSYVPINTGLSRYSLSKLYLQLTFLLFY